MIRTRVGYAGGTKEAPTYRSLGDHSETVEVDYDPARISFTDLLRAFWTGHDPTYRSWSRQYASFIFVHNEEQRRQAEASKAEVERQRGTVATRIVDYSGFTLAEDYHQKHSLRQFPSFEREYRLIYPDEKDFVASTAVARVNGYLGGEGTYETLRTEVDRFGLSPERKAELLEMVKRSRSHASCPVPADR